MSSRDACIVLRAVNVIAQLSSMCIEVIVKTLTDNASTKLGGLPSMPEHNVDMLCYLCNQCPLPLTTRDILIRELLKHQQLIPASVLSKAMFTGLITDGFRMLDMSYYNNSCADDGGGMNDQDRVVFDIDPLLLTDIWNVLINHCNGDEHDLYNYTSSNEITYIKLSNSKFNDCIYNMFASLQLVCQHKITTDARCSVVPPIATLQLSDLTSSPLPLQSANQCLVSALLHFEFANCQDLTDSLIDVLCMCCPNIVYLDIQNCALLTEEAILFISKLGRSSDSRYFVHSPLRHLDISYNSVSANAMACLVASGVGACLQTLIMRGLNCEDSFMFPLVQVSAPPRPPPGHSCTSPLTPHAYGESDNALKEHSVRIRALDICTMRCLTDVALGVMLTQEVLSSLRSLKASDTNLTAELLSICFGLDTNSSTSVSKTEALSPDTSAIEGVKFIDGSPYESLQELELCWCDEVETGILNRCVAKCPNLESVSLRSTSANSSTVNTIAGHCFAHLVKLDVSSCADINNDSMLHLAETCVQLRFLDVSWSFIEDAGLEKLLCRCPDIEVFLMQGCKYLTAPDILLDDSVIGCELDATSEAAIKTETVKHVDSRRCVLDPAKYPCSALAFLDFSWTNMMSKSYAVAISHCRPSVTVVDYYMQAFRNGEMVAEYM